MIKRIAAYCFILLANIIILAHTVVPHHHHQNVFCIESTPCQNSNVGHSPKTPEKHQHDGGSSTICILKQAVIIPSNQGKEETDIVICSHNHTPDLHVILPYASGEALINVFKIAATLPEGTISFSSFLTTSAGLRAPPLV